MKEINTNDLVKMRYNGFCLTIQYFRDGKVLCLPKERLCPDILSVILEVMRAIDYNKNLGQAFKSLA